MAAEPGHTPTRAPREKRSRFARWRRRAAIFSGVMLVLIGATLGYGWWWFDKNVLAGLPSDLSAFKEYRPNTTVRVYAADETLVDSFSIERRVWVDLEELPEAVSQAFIASEDRRFWEHQGVDMWSIARAAWSNYQAGSVSQGGSTLTQQLVKNLIVGNERSYERKLKEAVLAYRLENELGKARILELYLNYVYLGSGNYGVEAAAQDYYGLSARDLDAGQAAMLAGLVPSPTRYSPRANPDIARSRRDVVLGTMADLGYLTRQQALDYSDDPIVVARRVPIDRSVGTAYVTAVRREVRRLMPGQIPYEHGFSVYTPLRLDTQRVAEQAIRDALAGVVKRQGRMAAVRTLPKADWSGFLARGSGLERDPADGTLAEPAIGACFEALVQASRNLDRLAAGRWLFALRREDREVLVRRRALPEGPPRPLSWVAQAGDVLRVCHQADGKVALQADRPWAEGAAVAVENATGRIVAMVGGYENGLEGFNRATQARRQPGSSFKPYVYAAALLHGRSQLDRIVDGPLSLPAGGGKTWSPRNYGGGFAGEVTLRRALSYSYNTPSVRLTLEVGAPEVARMAGAMGVQTPIRRDPTIALGSSEVTPLDQAMGYSTIARLGRRADPVYIDTLVDVNGEPFATAGDQLDLDELGAVHLPGGPGERVLPPGIAYELADMLREVVRAGTATRAYKAEFDRGGKTGTTNDWVDAWYCGFTARYTIVVWIGTDGTSSLGPGETGGRAALPAWLAIAATLPEVPGERLPVPDDAMRVKVDGRWIGLARGHVPATALPIRRVGPEPLPSFGGP